MNLGRQQARLPRYHHHIADDCYSTVLCAVGMHCALLDGTPMLAWFWWRNSRGCCYLCGDRPVVQGPPSKVSRLLAEHARYHVNLLGRDKVRAIAGALSANVLTMEAGDLWNLAIELVADVLGPAPLPGVHLPLPENVR